MFNNEVIRDLFELQQLSLDDEMRNHEELDINKSLAILIRASPIFVTVNTPKKSGVPEASFPECALLRHMIHIVNVANLTLIRVALGSRR